MAATIYQRPRAQGQIAFRMLHEFLVEGAGRTSQVPLPPHLVMRGNLDFFLQRQSQESAKEKVSEPQEVVRDLATKSRLTEVLRRRNRGGSIAYLGIDVGTSGTRALVMDEAGEGRRPPRGEGDKTLLSPKPGWAEQMTPRLVASLWTSCPEGA